MDLAQLRSFKTNKNNSLSKIAAAMSEQSSKNSYQDNRYWQATADKAGNASAVIRFLPTINEDNLPWIKMYTHGFQGPSGRWYINNCRTTIGQEDPCVDHTSVLWNSGLESDKDIARQRKRKLSYHSNVLVIEDPANPENNGKVFIFKYGKKIFDMIGDKITPQFEDEIPCDVFHPYEGANFRLRMRKVDDFANFDKSTFSQPSMIDDDEEKMLEILSQRHDLQELLDPKHFKSYDELKRQLDVVLKAGGSVVSAEDVGLAEDAFKTKKEKEGKTKHEPVSVPDTSDDVDMQFFKDLIND